ncbi:MAG: chemotaxis protein CheB [Campylobacterota bacterium]|nr:chemotaxis protein CheB [Campylobacterota bacterium]
MTNIFIIDDSVLFRTKMSKDIESQVDLKIIGTANDAVIAQKRFKMFDDFPEIVILDVEMPKIDGLTFLENYLSKVDTKVIVCTSNYKTHKRKALLLGAVDVIDKSQINANNSAKLIEAIKKVRDPNKKVTSAINTSYNHNLVANSSKIVALGASTGGLEVLEDIFSSLPSSTPPILVVQHMGRDIMPTFVPKLKSICKVNIKEAIHNELVKESTVYIAPFGKHLTIKDTVGGYKIVISDGEKVSYHKPSIDLLFNSVASCAKNKSSAFILTGMGTDGVEGIKNIKNSGGKTFAQDEQSCKVFGMPKAAIESKMIDKIIKPQHIVSQILSS